MNSPWTNSEMNILFIGDLGGSKSNHLPIMIDRDNFDEVIDQLSVNIQLSSPPDSHEKFCISISELDDFHPDQIYQSHEVFARLRQLRRQLSNNTTFHAAAETIQGWLVPKAESSNLINESNNKANNGNLLDSILDSSGKQNNPLPESLIEQLIKEVISPYITAADDPNKKSYMQAVDNALADQMRQILHDEEFKEIESSWRDLYFLIRRLETGAQLKLHILDSGKSKAQETLDRALSSQPNQTWSLILGHYYFSATTIDISLLSKLGSTAEKFNTPIFSSATTEFLGLADLSENTDPDEWPLIKDPKIEQQWSALRASTSSHYLCLCLPRFLNRYPYSKKSSPIDSFEFEELKSTTSHQKYAWGNGATLLTYMVSQAHSDNSQPVNPNKFNRIGNLPHHYFDDDGEWVMKPCAEIELTSKGGEIIVTKGLIPIFSVRNQDTVQVGRLHSIAINGSLNAPWC